MKRYFKVCLWSPLWLPGLLGIFAYGAECIWPEALARLPQWLVLAGFILVMSLVFGGVQYLLTMILLWPKINFCDPASWLKWVLRLPLIFAPILLLGLLLVFAWNFDGVVDLFEILPLAAVGVVVGYVYVAVWILGYALARCVRRMRERTPRAQCR